MATHPTGQQYRDALFSPTIAFQDPALRDGKPDLTPLGMPKAISGGSASIFTVTGADGRRWAVKCFTREVPQRADRYEKIASVLQGISSPWKVGFDYLPAGILCEGAWYPVVKMEWIETQGLLSYVEENLDDPGVIGALNEAFTSLMEDLEGHGIAHGDLQHGNILVTPSGELRLIDYDGMYVPGIDSLGATEIGHVNYQSPARTAQDWGPHIDRFSAWVIHASLEALSLDPDLWELLHADGDEALLFHQADFADRDGSPAYQALADSAYTDLQEMASNLDFLWSADLAAIPPLVEPTPPAKAKALPTWMTANRAAEAEMRLREDLEEARQDVSRIEAALEGISAGLDRAIAWIREDAESKKLSLDQQHEAVLKRGITDVEALDAQISDLIKDKEGKLSMALKLLQNEYVTARLRNIKVPSITIPGISSDIVRALASHGVETAGDFTDVFCWDRMPIIVRSDGQKMAVRELGEKQSRALADWRTEMENRARASQPTDLPKPQHDKIIGNQLSDLQKRRTAILTRTAIRQAGIRAKRDESARKFENRIKALTEHFTDLRAPLEAELAEAQEGYDLALRKLGAAGHTPTARQSAVESRVACDGQGPETELY